MIGTSNKKNQDGLYGIFMSILYLADEADKLGIKATHTSLMLSARCFVEECKNSNPQMMQDMSAALDFYTHCVSMRDGKNNNLNDTLRQLNASKEM